MLKKLETFCGKLDTDTFLFRILWWMEKDIIYLKYNFFVTLLKFTVIFDQFNAF